MFGYLCKYVPAEIFGAFGIELVKIEPDAADYTQAETLLHANVCSFIKAVLEDVLNHDYEGVVLTACCDSTRRLFDALTQKFPEKFIVMLDLPHKVNDFAVKLYTEQISGLVKKLEEYSGKTFDMDAFLRNVGKKNAAASARLAADSTDTAAANSADAAAKSTDTAAASAQILTDSNNAASSARLAADSIDAAAADSTDTAAASAPALTLGLMGARCNSGILELLAQNNVRLAFDLTCSGLIRDTYCRDGTLFSYTESLLNQIPCMRMQNAVNRRNFVQGFLGHIDGILYHTVKFCDFYAYEYAAMKDNLTVPVLSIETDSTRQCAGQIRTRVEAFLESLRQQKENRRATGKTVRTPMIQAGGTPMYFLGIDSGSTSTNAVLINEKKEILASCVIRTGAKSSDSAAKAYAQVLKKAGITPDRLTCAVSTGYGRVSIPFADKNLTEISCHGKGAHFLNPDVRTILDIGGQDSKGIRLNEKGEVVDFVMNDKCAAGTGRFLEMMARTLELEITQLGPISLEWKEDIEISSMCSVFAESEVISLIAQNKEKCDIAHGIHKAIAGKALALLRRIHMEPEYMMTGGVAQNPGVVKVLEEALGAKLFIYEEPEIVGALGAALYGLE